MEYWNEEIIVNSSNKIPDNVSDNDDIQFIREERTWKPMKTFSKSDHHSKYLSKTLSSMAIKMYAKNAKIFQNHETEQDY